MFLLDSTNGARLVAQALEGKGWTRLRRGETGALPQEADFQLHWADKRSVINYETHRRGQLVNHIPNNTIITTKVGLFKTLSSRPGPAPSFLPHTFRLDRPCDCMELLRLHEKERAKYQSGHGPQPIWIVKPTGANCGNGVRVVHELGVIRRLCLTGANTGTAWGASRRGSAPAAAAQGHTAAGSSDQMKTALVAVPAGGCKGGKPPAYMSPTRSSSMPVWTAPSAGSHGALAPAIAQRYITNPLLLDGRKFDLRVYCLIARTAPHYLWYYHPGYARLSLQRYGLDPESLADPLVHLTNAAMQKKHPQYAKQKGTHIWSMRMVSEWLVGAGVVPSLDFVERKLHRNIKRIMMEVYRASRDKFYRKEGYFDLLGFDFMMDDKLELYLLEINTNPALSLDSSPVLTELLPRVVANSLDIVLAAQPPGADPVDYPSAGDIVAPEGYELLVCEKGDFEFKTEPYDKLRGGGRRGSV